MSDIAGKKEGDSRDHIKNWMRSRNIIQFLGYWEQLHNPSFNVVEFDHIKKDSGTNKFLMSPDKWCKSTNSIGIFSKKGKYGGVYAHKEIALEFATWIDPLIKLLLLKEYQCLKDSENQEIEWNQARSL